MTPEKNFGPKFFFYKSSTIFLKIYARKGVNNELAVLAVYLLGETLSRFCEKSGRGQKGVKTYFPGVGTTAKRFPGPNTFIYVRTEKIYRRTHSKLTIWCFDENFYESLTMKKWAWPKKGVKMTFPRVGTGSKSCAGPNTFTYVRGEKIRK